MTKYPLAGELDLSGFAPAPTRPKQQRRRRTGRSVQFNIKATPEVIERFIAIADRQGWVFGEALGHAVDALEQSLLTRKSEASFRIPAGSA
jgi:hypothetical protein